jgi:hypothetical protein
MARFHNGEIRAKLVRFKKTKRFFYSLKPASLMQILPQSK